MHRKAFRTYDLRGLGKGRLQVHANVQLINLNVHPAKYYSKKKKNVHPAKLLNKKHITLEKNLLYRISC
jgi:hypothetical protein